MVRYTQGYVTGFALEQIGVALLTAGASKAANLTKFTTYFIRALDIARGGVGGIAIEGVNYARKAVVATYLVHAASAPTDTFLRRMAKVGFTVERYIPGGRFSSEQMTSIFNSLREKGVYEADRVVLEMARTTHFKPLVASAEHVELFHRRYLQSMMILEAELPAGSWPGTEALAQVIDSVLPPGHPPANFDRVGELLHALDANTHVGRQMAVDTIAGAAGKTSDTIILDGLKVSGQIKDVYPKMYHYADEGTLLDHAVENVGAAGVWELEERIGGRYITPENLFTQASALDRLQLPKKRVNGAWQENPTAGRFKCIIETVDIADDCRIPRQYDPGCSLHRIHYDRTEQPESSKLLCDGDANPACFRATGDRRSHGKRITRTWSFRRWQLRKLKVWRRGTRGSLLARTQAEWVAARKARRWRLPVLCLIFVPPKNWAYAPLLVSGARNAHGRRDAGHAPLVHGARTRRRGPQTE